MRIGVGVFTIVVAAAHAAAAPTCPPAVIVAGDVAATKRITELLAARTIAPPTEGCPAVRASIEPFGGELLVSILDLDGRRTQREVADVETAAALIESFTLSALPAPAVSTPLPAPPAPPAPHDLDEQPAILVTHIGDKRLVRGALAASLESSLASDGSVWLGVKVRACVDLGPLCVGGAARFSRDAELTGSAERTETARSESAVLLTAEWPIMRGRWSIAPGLGIGVGWVHLRRDVMSGDGDQQLELDTGGLRGEARVGISVPIGRSIALTFGGALGIAPAAHTQTFHEEGVDIAAEPRAFGRLDIGIELGYR